MKKYIVVDMFGEKLSSHMKESTAEKACEKYNRAFIRDRKDTSMAVGVNNSPEDNGFTINTES